MFESSHPEVLRTRPDAIVRIGEAPDGLPLFLSIARNRDARDYVDPLAAMLGQPRGGPYAGKLAKVAEDVRSILSEWSLRQQLWPEACGGKETLYYVTRNPIQEVLGPNLFSVLVSPVSPLAQPATGARIDSARTSTTARRAQSESPHASGRALMVHARRSTHLAVGLDGGRIRLARCAGSEVPALDRDVICESAGALKSAAFRIVSERDVLAEGALSDARRYEEIVREHFLESGEPALRPMRLEVSVDRREVAGAIHAVAVSVAGLHRRGEIHGDLKPANILISEEGPTPIDSLKLSPGERAFAWSPSWGAPEQVLSFSVCAGSDLYPLGLMLCSILNAVVYGRVSMYAVPVGEHQKRTEFVYENPEVYLDREAPLVPADGIHPWQSFLQRSLSFDPATRGANASAWAEELSALLKKFPTSGLIAFDWPAYGHLATVSVPGGGEILGRIVADHV